MKKLTHTSTAALVTCGAVLSALMMVAAPVVAAEPGTARAGTSSYEKERADCLAGRTAQDVKTCLKEAAAARDDTRRGQLSTASSEELKNNALLRCQRVAEADRQDCRDMVMGAGSREGSVADGAVLKRIDRMIEENPSAAGVPASEASAPTRPNVPPQRQPKATPAK